jgi:hypothetical protein
MALDLGNLINFYNGTALLEAGTQEWGYIDAGWHLMIPDTYNNVAQSVKDYWLDYHLGHNPFTEQDHIICTKENFLKANYRAIFAITNNADIALFGAMFRMAIMETGCFATAIARRHVSVDEYTIVAPLNGDWNNAANNVPNNPNANAIAQYVRRFHLTLVSQLAFIFCARGHHYTNELNEHYKRLQDACFMANAPGFNLPNNENLYRNFVHCFGMSVLLDLTLLSVRDARIPAAMTVRFTPHAPIAGVAHITTLKAILNSMEKEMLWKQVKAKFQASLDVIDIMVRAIHERPYEYHVSSMILTGHARRVASEESIVAFNELSQICLGYLEYLGNRNSLHKQKAVTSKAGGLGPIAETWEEAFTQYGKPDIKHLTAPEFILEMFPSANSVEFKVSRVIKRDQISDKKAELEIRAAELDVTIKERQVQAQINI